MEEKQTNKLVLFFTTYKVGITIDGQIVGIVRHVPKNRRVKNDCTVYITAHGDRLNETQDLKTILNTRLPDLTALQQCSTQLHDYLCEDEEIQKCPQRQRVTRYLEKLAGRKLTLSDLKLGATLLCGCELIYGKGEIYPLRKIY